MIRPRFASLPLAVTIIGGAFLAACSGQLEPTTTGGSSSGSSSGGASSSGSSSGSSSSSGAGPDCGELGLPAIAEQCPDGSYAPAEYVVQNGQCVITYTCPTSPTGPLPFPPPSPTPSPPSPPPSPPTCSAMLPNQCASCLGLPKICEVCSTGQTECAHYVLQNFVCGIEVCPPGSGGKPLPPAPPNPPPPPSPQPGGCSQGAMCSQGEGCGTAVSAGSNACSTTCECTPGGYFNCTETCPPPEAVDAGVPVVDDGGSGIPGCSQGDPCTFSSGAGTGCGGGPIAGGCFISCTCGSAGYLNCATTCP